MTTRGVDPPDGVPKPQVSPASPPTRDERWSALRIELQDANARIAALESELAAVRQIVADVETCRGVGVENGVTICGDAEIAIVTLTWPALHDDRGFESSTWQAALHAAAEHVRNTNPERTENEV